MIALRVVGGFTRVARRKRSSEPKVLVIRHRIHMRRETNMYAEIIQSVKRYRRELARLGYKESMIEGSDLTRTAATKQSQIEKQPNLD